MKNRVKIAIIFLILFLNVFLYIIPSSYEKKYKVDGYKIIEKYNNKKNKYVFEITGKHKFVVSFNGNYKAKKKLIKSIKKVNIEDGYCIIPNSKTNIGSSTFYPLCVRNNEYISYHLISELKGKIDKSYYKELDNIDEKYKSINIYNLNNNKYYIWNYTGFNLLSEDNNKTIDIFNSDYYQIDLATKINNYLFIPDYDQGYSFNSAYVINMKNGKKEKWEMKYEISFQSRVVGTNNKSIFLVDEKSKEMYEIVPHKMKIRKVSGKLLIGDKFEKYNINKIINNKLSFKPTKYYDYTIEDKKLYQIINDIKTLISDNNVKHIVYQNDEVVYYLSNDDLYMFDPKYGNVKLMSYFEWEFNYDNLIFIY